MPYWELQMSDDGSKDEVAIDKKEDPQEENVATSFANSDLGVTVTSPFANSDEDDEEEEEEEGGSAFSSTDILESFTDEEEEEEEEEGEVGEAAQPPVIQEAPWLDPPSSSDTGHERRIGSSRQTDDDDSTSYSSSDESVHIQIEGSVKKPADIVEILKCTLMAYIVVTALCYAILVFVSVIAVLLTVVQGTAKFGLLLVAFAAVLTGTAMCCVYRMQYTTVHEMFSSCCRRSDQKPNS